MPRLSLALPSPSPPAYQSRRAADRRGGAGAAAHFAGSSRRCKWQAISIRESASVVNRNPRRSMLLEWHVQVWRPSACRANEERSRVRNPTEIPAADALRHAVDVKNGLVAVVAGGHVIPTRRAAQTVREYICTWSPEFEGQQIRRSQRKSCHRCPPYLLSRPAFKKQGPSAFLEDDLFAAVVDRQVRISQTHASMVTLAGLSAATSRSGRSRWCRRKTPDQPSQGRSPHWATVCLAWLVRRSLDLFQYA